MSAFPEIARRLLKPVAAGPLVTVELRFGTDVSEAAVEALLAALTGLHRDAVVVFETFATEDAFCHLLRADQATLDTVSGQLRGLLPSTRIEPTPTVPHLAWRIGAQVSWSRHALLRTDGAAQTAAGLLAALGPLGRDEALLVRLVLRPGRPAPLPAADKEGAAHQPNFGLDWLLGPARVQTHVVSGVRAKNGGPLLEANLMLAVASGHPKRSAHLLGRPIAVVRARRGGHGRLTVRRLNANGIERALQRLPRGGDLLSPAELAGLVGFPIDAPSIPGLRLGASPLLMPDRRIPDQGRLLGISTWPQANNRGLAQPVIGALSHTLICGGTGSGKSALVQRLAISDIAAGRGLLVVDGKGDLVRDLVERIPANRIDDVIVLDPAAPGPVPGLRVFGRGGDPELAADLVLGVLRDLFRDSWGVRSDQWLRAGLVTLAHDPTATLGDLPFLFTDDAYRRRLVGKLTDPMLLATWAAFEAMKPSERSNQLGAPLNKLAELLGRRVLRTVLSQPKPTLDLHEALRRNRIVLVSLSPGQLGSPATRLLGALIVHQLFSAVQARAALPPAARKPFLAYIDEPKVLGDIPIPLDGIFELARGMGVGLTLTAQSLTQLPLAVRNAALTNAASMVAFRQTADDAELLARHLSGITAEGLQSLGAFEMIARIGLGPGDVAAPTSGRTLPPPPITSDANVVRRVSAERYGADPAAVDQALAERHGHRPDTHSTDADAPVGRRRRNP